MQKANSPIYLSIVWHMHQPYYKDLVAGEYRLPWVRMHGIKDYFDMVSMLRGFPSIRQNFNLVPCLMEQIEDYTDNQAKDLFIDLSLKPADKLEKSERVAILYNFFFAEWENMIKPYPRYWHLLKKRGFQANEGQLEKVEKIFNLQDFLDLQVWFNLTWFDPYFQQNDAFLQKLIEKGEGFTEEEKGLLLQKQIEVMRKIVPEYRELSASGQVELSTTPFYHPILPLLCNTNRARDACPQIVLPRHQFMHPEDAQKQVEMAVAYHEKLFGAKPVGMWPSEGSVSEEVVPIIADAGIRWIATDEEILTCSLLPSLVKKKKEKKDFLFQPYRVEVNGRELNILFRDHGLSDLIGFVYSRWNPEDAAKDFMHHIHQIRDATIMNQKAPLVTVILDGENAWEHYKNDGWDFFTELYTRLGNDPLIETTTVRDYLERFPPQQTLPRLHAGSWINHNFRVWIGHEEDNLSWDALYETREFLVRTEQEKNESLDPKKLEMAWREIHIAEGSDWNWWYGDDHSSQNDKDFDELYRKHLANVYTLLGENPPDRLFLPIRREKPVEITSEITAFMHPTIDGLVTNYYEWIPAALYDVSTVGGTMHQADSLIRKIYYGFDLDTFYLRMDPTLNLDQKLFRELTFQIHFVEPQAVRIMVAFQKGKLRAQLVRGTEKPEDIAMVAYDKVIELGLLFSKLQVAIGDQVSFFVLVKRNDMELEKWPLGAYLSFRVPSKDFEAIMWSV
jgi:alpha-amylase/alpha-mannosidase (GH57 family)